MIHVRYYLGVRYRGRDVPIFTVPPQWAEPVSLRMIDRVIVRESLDVSEERLQTRPRPLYGLRYRTTTLTEQETGYIRRVIELPDGIPFGVPMWQDRVRLTEAISQGDTTVPVESTDDSLWDTFDSLALIWSAFNQWEVIDLSAVASEEITTAHPVARDWPAGTYIVPLAFGSLRRNDKSNFTSDHSRFNADFEERFTGVVAEYTADGTPASGCCQTLGRYFSPAYSFTTDRVAAGFRGPTTNGISQQYRDAIIRVLSPSCTGVSDIEDSRVTGGASWVAANNKLVFGVQGGSDGAAGDELCFMVDAATLAITALGGFPNPNGNAYGANALYIPSTGKVWLQLFNCGSDNAFAIIDPIAGTYSLLADATLALGYENSFAYCAESDAVYLACVGGVLARIDASTLAVTEVDLSAIGAARLQPFGICVTSPIGGNAGSGKIWVSWIDQGVIPALYGIALLDPAADSLAGGFSTRNDNRILWYSLEFDCVVMNGETAGTFSVYEMDLTRHAIGSYEITGSGSFADSQGKIVLPTFTAAGEYCLSYFDRTALSLPTAIGNHLLPDLVAFWEMDQATGDVLDSSGNGRDLTENATVPYTALGKRNGARIFGGAGTPTAYLKRASEAALSPGAGPYTIAGWLRVDDLNQDGVFYAKSDGVDGLSFLIEYDHSGTNSILVYYSTDGVAFSGPISREPTDGFAAQEWYFVFVRITGTNIEVGVMAEDDTLNYSVTPFTGTVFNNSTVPITLGNWRDSGSPSTVNALDGAIDDVAVWARALSDCEIEALFNDGAGRPFSTFNSLACV